MDCRLLPCLKMWKTARIAECVADKGKKEFCRCRDHLEELERMARENEHPLLCTSPPDDATADIDSKIDVTSEIGDVGEEVTNLCGDTNTKRPVEATPEMNNTTESVSSAKGKLGTIPSPKRKLEMDEQEKAVPRAPKARSRSTKTLVQLNPASRASGRPKLTASFKKAKKAKDIEETMVFVDDIATIGDVTLENFEDTVKKKVLSIAEIGDTLGPAQVLETDVRFMLPDHSIPMPRGDKLDPKKLQYVRH
ncbi:hypothetical protein PC113_g23206 [Phytophthora cactorum]|uniref:Uncharacterized protein n=1 Tax=Phytophthora cactorum TaxID=29920 RepID=A0A8T0XV96_9STRA|nr:hypothetical protein PC113_g23206 [Phytophthora cactorum]